MRFNYWYLTAWLGGMQKSGTITYNGKTFKQFVPERTSAYVTQYDEHMAELTVRETLDFSRRVQGAGNRPGESPAKLLLLLLNHHMVHQHAPQLCRSWQTVW